MSRKKARKNPGIEAGRDTEPMSLNQWTAMSEKGRSTMSFEDLLAVGAITMLAAKMLAPEKAVNQSSDPIAHLEAGSAFSPTDTQLSVMKYNVAPSVADTAMMLAMEDDALRAQRQARRAAYEAESHSKFANYLAQNAPQQAAAYAKRFVPEVSCLDPNVCGGGRGGNNYRGDITGSGKKSPELHNKFGGMMREQYFGSLAEAMRAGPVRPRGQSADFGSVDQGSYHYADPIIAYGPPSPIPYENPISMPAPSNTIPYATPTYLPETVNADPNTDDTVTTTSIPASYDESQGMSMGMKVAVALVAALILWSLISSPKEA